MEIETLYLVKDKINIFNWFNIKIEILTYDEISAIELIKKFKNMDSIDFLKDIAKVYKIKEYCDSIVLYKKSERKGYLKAIGAFVKKSKTDDNSNITLNEFIKKRDELELIYFDRVKIDMTYSNEGGEYEK